MLRNKPSIPRSSSQGAKRMCFFSVPQKHPFLKLHNWQPFRKMPGVLNFYISSHVIFDGRFLIPSWVFSQIFIPLASLETPKDARAHTSSGKFYAFSAHPQLGDVESDLGCLTP